MRRRGRSEIDRGEHRENIRLDDSGQQLQRVHQHREEQRRNDQQNRSHHGTTHHVTAEPHRQCQGAGQLADQIQGQHDRVGSR